MIQRSYACEGANIQPLYPWDQIPKQSDNALSRKLISIDTHTGANIAKLNNISNALIKIADQPNKNNPAGTTAGGSEQVDLNKTYTETEVRNLVQEHQRRADRTLAHVRARRVINPLQPQNPTEIININIHVQDIKLPKFKGGSSEVESFCASLASKRKELKEEGEENPDRLILKNLSSSMDSDDTKIWYNSLRERAPLDTVEEFCSHLRSMYGEKVPVLMKWDKLGEVTQQKDEPLQRYALRMETKAASLKISVETEEALSRFIKGLYFEGVRRKVMAQYERKNGGLRLERVGRLC